MEFQFLNNALNDFTNTITSLWGPFFQQQGINILLALSVLAFLVQAIEFFKSQDLAQFIMGLTFTVTSIAVLYYVFLNSEGFANALYQEFLQLGQRMTGESPNVLTPSGIMEQGLVLARIFWDAAGHASWFLSPISALETIIASFVVVLSFGIAAIIYLLSIIEITSLVVGGSIMLAFAASPWTWEIFPGWGLKVLSACFKLFFLLAVLAALLFEASHWANDMAAVSGGFAENISRMMQVAVESLLFLGAIYYLPGIFAHLVTGSTGAVMTAGEAMIGGLGGAAAGYAGGALESLGARAASSTSGAASMSAAAINTMLFR